MFKDDDIIALISNSRFQYIRSLMEQKVSDEMPLGFGTFEMPRAIDLLLEKHTSSEKICEVGAIRLNSDTTITQMPAEGWLNFMKQDTADLEEFKFELNPEEIDLEATQTTHNALFSNSVFYDVQKLLIQEKGEDKYYPVFNKKKE